MKHTSAESFNLSAIHVNVCSGGPSIDEDHKCLERKGFEDYGEEDFCLDYKKNVFQRPENRKYEHKTVKFL